MKEQKIKPEIREALPTITRPMKPAKTETLPKNDSEWISEIKWDGVRAIIYVDRIASKTQIQSSSGRDITQQFPEFWPGLSELLKKHSLVLDCEIVFEDGRRGTGMIPSKRTIKKPPETDPKDNPERCSLFVLDLLYLDGQNLLYKPLIKRRKLLEKLLSTSFQNKHGIAVTPYWTEDHEFVLIESKRQNYEGIVLKQKDSTYFQGESNRWLKIKF